MSNLDFVSIQVHRTLIAENERLYGPGKRLVIFLQGCKIHCPGCTNSHIWDFDGGTTLYGKDILQLCEENHVDGITLHGGEPLDQAGCLVNIIPELKHKYSVVLFTGYEKNEIFPDDKKAWDKTITKRSIWNMADLIVAGRFDITKRNLHLQFRGSTNQVVYKNNTWVNYEVKDGAPETTMFTIGKDGSVDLSGFMTPDADNLLKEIIVEGK